MRLGVLTDLHLAQPGHAPVNWNGPFHFEGAAERYRQALRVLADHDVAAIVVLGDLTHDADQASLDQFGELSGLAPVPVWAVGGNHDIAGYVPPGLGVGAGPAGAVAEAGRGQGAAPDSGARSGAAGSVAGSGSAVSLTPVSVTRLDQSATPLPRGGVAVGALATRRTPDGQFTLQPAYPLAGAQLVLSHFPVLTQRTRIEAAGLTYAGDAANRPAIAASLSGPVVVLCGHLHVRAATARQGIFQYAFGPQIQPPFDLALLDLTLTATEVLVEVRQLSTTPARAALEPALTRATHDGATWQIDHPAGG
jgi:predicted phosphodiesterase